MDKTDPLDSQQSNLESILPVCSFVNTGKRGGFAEIYHPLFQGNLYDTVALKLFSPSIENNKNIKRSFSDIPNWQVDLLLKDEDYIHFEVKDIIPERENLTIGEQALIYMAYEHYLYTGLYGEYVLPSRFLRFKIGSDIYNQDGELTYCVGQVVGVSIQKYEANIKTPDKWDNLTDPEKRKVELFIKKLSEVFYNRGYYPDPYIVRNGNIGFTEKGKLLLLDTNCIYRYQTAFDKTKFERVIDSLKQKISQ